MATFFGVDGNSSTILVKPMGKWEKSALVRGGASQFAGIEKVPVRAGLSVLRRFLRRAEVGIELGIYRSGFGVNKGRKSAPEGMVVLSSISKKATSGAGFCDRVL